MEPTIRGGARARGDATRAAVLREFADQDDVGRRAPLREHDRLPVGHPRPVEDPAAGEREVYRSRLSEIIDHLEKHIKAALDQMPKGQISDRNAENFYRLLGAYRGVSEALVIYAGSAATIDWEQWKEERF